MTALTALPQAFSSECKALNLRWFCGRLSPLMNSPNILLIRSAVAMRTLAISRRGRFQPLMLAEYYYDKLFWSELYVIAHRNRDPLSLVASSTVDNVIDRLDRSSRLVMSLRAKVDTVWPSLNTVSGADHKTFLPRNLCNRMRKMLQSKRV
jgi:hypothetical protein